MVTDDLVSNLQLNYTVNCATEVVDLINCSWRKQLETRKTAQGVAQWKVSATRTVVDAALLRGGKSRCSGHRIANISRDCGRI